MSLQWNAESLWEQIEPMLPGLSVEVMAHCPSTNTALLERARVHIDPDSGIAQVRRSRESAAFGRRAADVQPCLLVAEHQTQGRGRLGRLWTSSPGASLTFSLSVPITRPDWSGLSLAVGVALAEALDPGSSRRIGLKWPNDLWVLDDAASVDAPPPIGRKLGGILIESVTVGASRLAVIGVGINVLPLDTAPLTHGYASVQELDADATPPSVLARVAAPLVQAVIDFNTSGFDGFLQRFAARDLLNGRAITTTQADLPLGTARGVDPDGALRVEAPDGAVQRLVGGEVSVRLQGNEPSEDEDSKAQDTGEDTPC
ncbi:MAG: hypothetical protein RLZZ618_304 [Pseudomonadota bacterium]|jgi:BirA family biotin operon repressor/biotin-[acetyl-CoA-carboxylase] ligase